MIFTFYSYKGGVGRSMALANVADLLARRGLRVLMVDFDLEAPGLEQFFPINMPKARRHPGLLDLLLSYKESMSMGGDPPALPPFKQIREHFILPVYEQLPEGGRLDLLPAGQREEEDQLASYALNLRTFDWQDFFFNWAGEMFFEWLRRTLVPELYDVVLVDSRTGVTEMGGICAYQLSDVIVMLCAANQQNLEGTYNVVENFFSERVQELRQHRPLQVLVVPARVEQRDELLLVQFKERFERLFGGRTPQQLDEAGLDLWQLMIPYEPRYAFDEQVVSRPRGEERREVAAAFGRLVHALALLAGPRTAMGRRLTAAGEGQQGSPEAPRFPEAQFDVTRRHAGYHAVLSYHRDHGDEMEALAHALERQGVRLFMDCWEALPGLEWRARSEDALFHSHWLLVGVGPEGLATWQSEQMRIAAGIREEGVDVIPILLADAEAIPGQFPSNALQFRSSDLLEDGEELCRLASVLRAPTSPAPQSRVEHGPPYVGLEAFGEQHAPLFFGRERLLGDLEERLPTERFTAVVGPSGCGKSSLIHAGLFPALRGGKLPGSEHWRLLTIRPGRQPLQNLARSLCSVEPRLVHDQVVARLEGGERALVDLASEILSGGEEPGGGRRRLVLFIDHFEDLYTLDQDAAQPGQFVANLMYAAGQQRGPVSIVVAIRSDFFSRIGEHPALTRRLQDNLLLVPALTRNELRRVVEEPARRVGIGFEPGLVDRIIMELGDEPGALPLLQFLLLQLWERRDEGWLTNAAYDGLGGVHGALTVRADRVFLKLSPEERDIARRILLRLVCTGEGTGDTRRRAALSELLPAGREAPRVREIIRRLSNARLLIVGDEAGETTVELAHEALIRGWKRLREWLKEDREFLSWQQRLQITLAQARHRERDEGAYLRGGALEEAQRWMKQRPRDLSAPEHRHIRKSIRRKQLRDWVRRGTFALLLMLTLTALGTTRAAGKQAATAKRQSRMADNQWKRAEGIASQLEFQKDSAQAARDSVLKINRLLVIQGQTLREERNQATRAEERAREEMQQTAKAFRRETLALEEATATRLRAEQALQRADSTEKRLRLALDSLHRLVLVAAAADSQATLGVAAASTTLDTKARRLVTISTDGTALLLDATSGSVLRTFSIPGVRFTSATFSTHDNLIATGGENGALFLWNSLTGIISGTPLREHSARIRKIAFSRDGRRVATASDDGTARVWDVRARTLVLVLGTTGASPVIDVGFAANGTVVSISADGTHFIGTPSLGRTGL